MTAHKKQATCHPDRANHYGGKCEACFNWNRDASAPCPHADRKKDKFGRCSSCMSRYYYLRRENLIGDKYGTIRKTDQRLGFENVKDPKIDTKKKTIKTL